MHPNKTLDITCENYSCEKDKIWFQHFSTPSTRIDGCKQLIYTLLWLLADDTIVSGFVEYMYSQILPSCFVAPLRPEFDLNDGQSYLVRIKN